MNLIYLFYISHSLEKVIFLFEPIKNLTNLTKLNALFNLTKQKN